MSTPSLLRALLLVTILSACGGTWSQDDIEFVEALPTKEDLSLSAPSSAGQTLESGDLGSRQDQLGKSAVYADVLGTTSKVNQFVGGLTAGLDAIRMQPPTKRGPGKRTWGPFNDDKHAGFELQVVIEKAATESFTYQLQERRKGGSAFTLIAAGSFKGNRATGGTGGITFDAQAAEDLGIRDSAKDVSRAELTYDMRGGEAKAAMVLTAADRKSTVRFDYLVHADGAGELTYTVNANLGFTRTAALETLVVKARWLKNTSGRVDLDVTGGDLGSAHGLYSECWDAASAQVFQSRNFECVGAGCTEGDAAKCSIAP